jgi:signal transduction histidine kinase
MNDGKRLKQVMDFLLDNAVKFTELGHIEFGYRIYEKDTLLFWVHDTGIGIEEEEQSRIFKPFYQIKDGNHIKFSGTGLGLSIASKIVHLMGGNIWVKSEYTQGTTMYFALNLVTQESLEDELASLGIEDE